MSLINDALKRARDAQRNDPPPGAPPLQPVESSPRGGAGWILAAAAILFLGAGGFILGPAFFGHKAPQAVTAKPPELPAPLPVVAAPVPVPVAAQPAATTNSSPVAGTSPPPAAVAAERLPKVQGILFNSAQPLAIVDGHTVIVGDRVGDFQVKLISKTNVVFQRPDGSLKTLELGK
jgi:hypothetical protein